MTLAGRTGSAAAADFDGDGALDLVAFQKAPPNVSLVTLRGDGRGGLCEASHTANPSTANPSFFYGAAVGDFDGDGHPDLADTLDGVVLLGDGQGGFRAPREFKVPGGTVVADLVIDLNRDGRADLVLAESKAGIDGVWVLLGDGAGGFAAPVHYSGGGIPHAAAAADLDGDGDLDVAVAGCAFGSCGLDLLLGDGAGAFGQRRFIDWTQAGLRQLAARDLDGDGAVDLAFIDQGGLHFLRGVGSGKFAEMRVSTVDEGAWLSDDVNGDGTPDAIVLGSDAVLRILFGDGHGGLAGSAPWGGAPARVSGAFLAGDFDGDGRADLATWTQGDPSTVRVARNPF